MIYEIVTPGDGFDYPFIWARASDIKNLNTEQDKIYISIANGRFCSGFISKEDSPYSIAEKLQCSIEQAMVVRHFVDSKYNDSEKESFTKRKLV